MPPVFARRSVRVNQLVSTASKDSAQARDQRAKKDGPAIARKAAMRRRGRAMDTRLAD